MLPPTPRNRPSKPFKLVPHRNFATMKHWDDSGAFDFDDDYRGGSPGNGDLDYDDSYMDDVFAKPRGIVNKATKKQEPKPKPKPKAKNAKVIAGAAPTAATAPGPDATAAGPVVSPKPKPSPQSSRPKKQKKNAKKVVYKISEREPDLFDDPVLWETRERKKIMEAKAAAEAAGAGPVPEEAVEEQKDELAKEEEDKQEDDSEMTEGARRLADFM